MCPIVETELWNGAAIKWNKHAVTVSIRCKGPCKGVFPGKHMAEVDTKTGLCKECKALVTP